MTSAPAAEVEPVAQILLGELVAVESTPADGQAASRL